MKFFWTILMYFVVVMASTILEIKVNNFTLITFF